MLPNVTPRKLISNIYNTIPRITPGQPKTIIRNLKE